MSTATWAPTSVGVREHKFVVPKGTWSEVEATVQLNLAVGAVLLVFFEVRRSWRRVYGPRLREFKHQARVPRDAAVFKGGLRRWPLAWALLAERVSNDEVRRCVGMDHFMVLIFVRMWKDLFFKGTCMGVVVLAVYARGGNKLRGFYSLTMRNIENGSDRLWVGVLFLWAWTVLVLRQLEFESKRYLRWRRISVAESADLQSRCSVIVERVRPSLRSDRALKTYLTDLGLPVFSAVVYLNIEDVERKLRDRDRAADQLRREKSGGDELNRANAEFLKARDAARRAEAELSPEEEVVHARKVSRKQWWACVETRLERFEQNYLGKLPVEDDDDEEEVEVLHRKQHADYARSSTAVVTFESLGTAADARQLLLTSQPMGMECVAGAPSPTRGFIWKNVGRSIASVEDRIVIADVILWIAAALATPVVTFIQLISNLDELAKYMPFLAPFFQGNYATLQPLVTGYLPVIGLLLLLALVPIFIERLAIDYVGLKARALVDAYVTPRHVYFQLLAIFVTTLSGSITSVLQAFLDHPSSLLTLLGTSVPQIAPYFLQTLAVKALFSLPLELAQVAPFVLSKLSTKRFECPAFKPSTTAPDFLMVVFVGALYAPIAPLILIAAFVYFFVADAVWTRQFLFVYVAAAEGGGQYIWPRLVFFSFLSLLVAQCTTLSYVSLLGGARQAPFLLPLPFLSAFSYQRIVRFLLKPAAFLDRETATKRQLYDSTASESFKADYYRQPVLNAESLTADDVLRESRQDDEEDADDFQLPLVVSRLRARLPQLTSSSSSSSSRKSRNVAAALSAFSSASVSPASHDAAEGTPLL